MATLHKVQNEPLNKAIYFNFYFIALWNFNNRPHIKQLLSCMSGSLCLILGTTN
jgi:hypothetical protein